MSKPIRNLADSAKDRTPDSEDDGFVDKRAVLSSTFAPLKDDSETA